MIDQQPQNILLDAVIVGDHAITSWAKLSLLACREARSRLRCLAYRQSRSHRAFRLSAVSREEFPSAAAARASGAARSIDPRVQSYFFATVTRLASSCPAMVGSARASATSCSAGVPSVEIIPRNAPTSRRCLTSARVSISQITGTPWRSRYCCADSPERQLEDSAENSRTISASIQGFADSSSSRFAPTFPICG